MAKGDQSTEVVRCDDHAAQLRSQGYTVQLVKEAPKAEKRKWDMASTNSLDAATEWLRKQSGALMVLVVRVEDVALAMDAGMDLSDFVKHLRAAEPQIGEAFERMQQNRKA